MAGVVLDSMSGGLWFGLIIGSRIRRPSDPLFSSIVQTMGPSFSMEPQS